MRFENITNQSQSGFTASRIPLLLFILIGLAWAVGPVCAQAPQEADNVAGSKPQVAAWEYRPYEVVVWIAHSNSWRMQGIEDKLIERIGVRSRLADASAWKLHISRAPNPWNWRLLSENFDRSLYSGDLQADVLHAGSTRNADKLIVVKVSEELGEFRTNVQEFDLKTQVWGAEVIRKAESADLDLVIFESIKTAFMPVTRIENVHDSDVRVRVRAIGIAHVAERDEAGQWQMRDNTGSPVWVQDSEILMPVIIRNDRRGNLESIKTIDWTFLAILGRDGPNLNCTTHSMRRAPLGQRTGGRTERLALCVRAPDRQTTLKLISNDKERIPLPDLEVFSRRPDQPKGTDNEFLGKTDWRGEIVIPPNEDPVRILLVKSGKRPLARVPVVPGLYDRQQTSMPNDEKRLYAEGVTTGLQNELMDNVARRNLISERIRIALEQSNLDKASELLKELRDVPNSQKFNIRLNTEKQRLLLGDDRQKEFINGYFDQLEAASNEFLNNSDEGQLSKQVQDAKRL